MVSTMIGRTDNPISTRALSNNRCRDIVPSSAKSVNERFSNSCLMYRTCGHETSRAASQAWNMSGIEAMLLSAGEINIDDDGASDTDVE